MSRGDPELLLHSYERAARETGALGHALSDGGFVPCLPPKQCCFKSTSARLKTMGTFKLLDVLLELREPGFACKPVSVVTCHEIPALQDASTSLLLCSCSAAA